MSYCSVCIEPFNKTYRFKVNCFNCDFKACRNCIKIYILNLLTEDTNCMNCNILWNDRFISDNLSKSFFNINYKNHISQIYFENKLVLIPKLHTKALKILENEKLNKILFNIVDKQKQILNIIIKTKKLNDSEINIIKRNIALKYTIHPDSILLKKIKRINNDYIGNMIEIENIKFQINKKNKNIEIVNEYKYPCSNEECNGLLRINKWKCELCEFTTCFKCFDIIMNEEHICCKNKIATTNLLKKDTKYCPTCSCGITKINGCNIMFCTKCNTSFDWKTLKIIKKNIHNPHYIQYMINNPFATKEISNIIINCVANPEITIYDNNRLLSINYFCNRIKIYNKYAACVFIGVKIIQFILHINHEITNIDNNIRKLNNQSDELLIYYILNRCSKDDLEKNIKPKAFKIKFLNERKLIGATLVDCLTDMIFHYSNNELFALNDTILNLVDVYTYNILERKDNSFFENYINENIFIKIYNKISDIKIQVAHLTTYCIEQDNILSKYYNKKSRFNIQNGLNI